MKKFFNFKKKKEKELTGKELSEEELKNYKGGMPYSKELEKENKLEDKEFTEEELDKITGGMPYDEELEDKNMHR